MGLSLVVEAGASFARWHAHCCCIGLTETPDTDFALAQVAGITMHEDLKVTGMTCGGCVTNVTHALKALAGVGEVKVRLSTGEASIEYDERLTSPAQMRLALKAAG